MLTRRTCLLTMITSPLLLAGLAQASPKPSWVGLRIKRDYEEVLGPNPKEWPNWNTQEARSDPYIPLPDGRRIPVKLRFNYHD